MTAGRYWAKVCMNALGRSRLEPGVVRDDECTTDPGKRVGEQSRSGQVGGHDLDFGWEVAGA